MFAKALNCPILLIPQAEKWFQRNRYSEDGTPPFGMPTHLGNFTIQINTT